MKIAIIGAGPRGLSLSERLIAHSKQNKQAILKNITSSSVSQQYIKPFYYFFCLFLHLIC